MRVGAARSGGDYAFQPPDQATGIGRRPELGRDRIETAEDLQDAGKKTVQQPGDSLNATRTTVLGTSTATRARRARQQASAGEEPRIVSAGFPSRVGLAALRRLSDITSWLSWLGQAID
jgi:hypothetical protein